MSGVHERLRAIERRLRQHHAEPLYTDEEIDDLDDDQATRSVRAEGDRLAMLAQLETEMSRGPSRRGREGPDQGRLW